MKNLKFHLPTLLTLLAIILSVSSCCPCRKGGSQRAAIEVGSEWQAIQIDSKPIVRSEGTISDDSTLRFGEDGKLSGKGACNNLMGHYSLDESGGLLFENIATTRMMCPNAEAEQALLEALARVDSYHIDGGVLMLFESGEVIMILENLK